VGGDAGGSEHSAKRACIMIQHVYAGDDLSHGAVRAELTRCARGAGRESVFTTPIICQYMLRGLHAAQNENYSLTFSGIRGFGCARLLLWRYRENSSRWIGWGGALDQYAVGHVAPGVSREHR